METTLALKAFVNKKDGLVTCRIGGKKKTVRLYPIDVREIHAKGTPIEFPPFADAPKSDYADAGADGAVSDPEPGVFNFEALDLDELKVQYNAALELDSDLPQPKGNCGKPWYVKTLADSGYIPEAAQ